MISAVFSLFSGGLRGGSVYSGQLTPYSIVPSAYKQDVVVLWFGTEVLEDTLLPESLHVIPVLNHTMSNRVMQSICPVSQLSFMIDGDIKAYLEFATASSPIKKSRSSIPLLLAK
jgi:hypothetical protein